jgi:hypothetical protein
LLRFVRKDELAKDWHRLPRDLFVNDPTTKCLCSRANPPLSVPVRERSHHQVSLFANDPTTKCPYDNIGE